MKRFGDYTDLVEIGRGGMSVVYRAKTPQGTLVALKLLHPALRSDLAVRQRFAQEAAFQLRHPHIVPVLDYGEHDGTPYLVMEYVSGESLAALVTRQGALSPQQLAPILEAVASALDYAHRNGVIHRDVKAANILLRHDGHVMLTDFGIARALDSNASTLTQGWVGSALFMSPEQVLGAPITPASDIYSLGVTLYFALTRRHPFMADSDLAIARMHAEATPRHVCTLNPTIPRAVGDVVMWALNKQPAQRPSSATSLARAFYAALTAPPMPSEIRKMAQQPQTARASAPPQKSPAQRPIPEATFSPRLLLVLWGAVLLAMGAVVVSAFTSNVSRGEGARQATRAAPLAAPGLEIATATLAPSSETISRATDAPTPTVTPRLVTPRPVVTATPPPPPTRTPRPRRAPTLVPTPFPQIPSAPLLPTPLEALPSPTVEVTPTESGENAEQPAP